MKKICLTLRSQIYSQMTSKHLPFLLTFPVEANMHPDTPSHKLVSSFTTHVIEEYRSTFFPAEINSYYTSLHTARSSFMYVLMYIPRMVDRTGCDEDFQSLPALRSLSQGPVHYLGHRMNQNSLGEDSIGYMYMVGKNHCET